MAVNRPTYATRRMVKFATDISTTAVYDQQVDSALDSAAESIDGLCHRRFYNVLETAYFEWPNFQRAYPWRIWFDERELASVTNPVPTVTTGGSSPQSIPDSAIFWAGSSNYYPPYTYIELDRSQSYAFGVGDTPQRDVHILGSFGYWDKPRSAGSLAAAVSSTTATTITVSDSSLADAGDVLTIDSESMLVRDTAMASTGQSQSGAGCSTASSADNQLTVSDGTQLHAYEVIQLDAERMLITGVTGNVATVIRSYDGTVLATHSSATVSALRLLTVTRGDFGSTAATHSNSAAITAQTVPGEVRELALAEALNNVFQKTSGYARTIGENQRMVTGGSLPDLRKTVYRRYGRKHRQAVI
jgi:hypothetical protein